MSILPLPVHQQVQLHVNPRKKTWRGSTELTALVPSGQQTVGLHCFNLSIQQVTVNGVAAEFTVYQYPSESLSDLTVEQLRNGSGKESQIGSVSEHAYDQYVRLMHKEQEPELIITIPQQQQQQQQEQNEVAVAGDIDAQVTPAAVSQAADTPVKSGTPAAAAAATTPKQPSEAAVASTPATAKPDTPAAPSPAGGADLNKQQQQQQPGLPGQLQQTLTITITFHKPPNSITTDTSLSLEQQCLVANPQLRRARGWFPCVDSPLHIYTPGAPHCLPYTFDLQLTVPPSFMAVCSGSLRQQTCTVLPMSQHGTATQSSNGVSNGANTVVVARTFEYSVATPVVPSQLSIAVGPFVAVQYSDLLAAAGTAAAALPAGSPVITIFAAVTDRVAAAVLAQQQQGAGDSSSSGSKPAASSCAAVRCLGLVQLRQLADTVKPLSVLLRAYDKVLSCMFPWSHLQVAVVPDGCLLDLWQAGLGSILLRDSCRITDNLVLEPRLASASCLAAALAQQYFGLLLLPKGPEDSWLLKGLAGWLEGQGLKQIVGSNELHYKRWQERVCLSAVDDGEQLGPLSPQIKEADKGFTAAWGRLHGTQDLEPCPAMAWKATAVIYMLERKIGEDELRKVLERYINGAKLAAANTAAGHQPDAAQSPAPKPLQPAVPTASGTTAGGTAAPLSVVAAAPVGVAAAAGAAAGLAERFMTTAKFMRTMGKKQGFKKEAPGFFNRWVHGTGIPQLTAGISWDSKRSLLLLALRQAGSRAVMQGALKASEPVVLGGENTGGAAPGGRACTLKVLVRELDACEEHPLQVDASSPISLHDIKVTSKLGPQRRRMQAAAGTGARRGSSSWVGGAAEDLDVSEAELRGVPVLWVQVDHSMEWLAAVQLRQPAHWWALQLEHSKDVVAQAQAVAGLCDQLGGPSSSPQLDKYIITVLGALMRNPGVFCRVRLDAAMALGSAAGKHQNNDAAVELFNFVRERLYDPYTGLMQPNDFTDLGEALLNHGLPAALARITMLGGYTPEGILAQLLELLTCSDNSSNPVDDGHWLAALVAALGQLRLRNAAELAKVLKELDRMLAHEAVVGTHNAVLGCASLKAVTQLATQMQHAGSAALLEEVRQLLLGYVTGTSSTSSGGDGRSHNASSRHLKATAYSCLLHVAAANTEAQLRDMMAGLEAAAAAAAASAQAGSTLQGDGQLYQQQVQQIAYTASYSQLLQQLLPLTAAADLKPPLLLDGVLGAMLQLLAAEQDPVQRVDICKAALLLVGRLEQQGYFELKATAVLPDSVTAAASPAAAVPAVVDISAPPLPAADGAPTASADPAAATTLPQQQQDNPQAATIVDLGATAAAAAAPDGGVQPPAAAAVSSWSQQQLSVVPVSVDMLLRVQQLLNSHHEPAVRQLAFMMLQKLAGQPATLYREREEDEDDLGTAAAATTAITAAGNTAAAPAGTAERGAAAGGAVSVGAAPSGSVRTGVTGARSSMPAASAGGMSVQHTGTTAPTKLRLGKLGIKKPPAAGASAASPSGAPASTAAAASDAVPGSSPGTATAVSSRPQLQVKLEQGVPAAASQQTPSSAAVTPFAATEQQQGKADRTPSLPPVHRTPAAAGASSQPSQHQQQQQLPANAPSAAGSVAQPPPSTAAAPPATPSSAAGVPVRIKPLTKLKTLSGGSTGSPAAVAAAAIQPAAAAPAPVQQQQQQHRQLAGVKRGASSQEPAPVAAGPAGPAAAAAAAGGAPALKKPKLKKAGIPGQPAQQTPAAAAGAAPPAATAAIPPPAAAVLAPAPSAAPSSSNVTASGMSGKKLKFKMPINIKKKE